MYDAPILYEVPAIVDLDVFVIVVGQLHLIDVSDQRNVNPFLSIFHTKVG